MPDFTILEPVSAGDIIDRAIRLYRRNFTPLIGVVAVPGVIYYVSSLLFWLGYSRLIMGGGAADFGGSELLMIAAGGLGMIVWLFVFMVALSGMSRAIGDNVMAGDPITFRKCFKVTRKRLGDIALMGLLTIALGAGLYFALIFVIFAVALLIGAGAALGAALGLPPGVGGVLGVIGIILLLAGAVILLLAFVSRIVFWPQALMIEGQSAGSALGRAFKLGAKNWYKVGAIALFNYFVTTSLLLAMVLPVGVVLYLTGSLTADILLKPGWSAMYTAASQLTSMLVLPIWIISFTFLYFDSRVRKEGYDIEVLSLGLQPSPQMPAPYWQPAMAGQPPYWAPGPGMPGGFQPAGYGPPGARPPGYPSQYPTGYQGGTWPGGYPAGGYPAGGYPAGGYPVGGYPAGGYPAGGYPAGGYPPGGYPPGGYPGGYPPPPPPGYRPQRPYVQTSPLGLAGPMQPQRPLPPPPVTRIAPVPAPVTPPAPSAAGTAPNEATPAVLIPNQDRVADGTVRAESVKCGSCGSAVKAGARFCHTCGKVLSEAPAQPGMVPNAGQRPDQD
ncbi:MAG TPA: hypothetical protein VEZ90_11035 [Blastocatellia bacterium]|nr:hypothetical protein [Blastocatellia bacterium]